VYLPCWLGVSGLYGLTSSQPLLVALVGATFGTIAAGRLLLRMSFAQRVERSFERARAVLRTLLIANALLLGAITVASARAPVLQPIFLLWSLIASVTCAAGTMTLAIDRVIGIAFPAAVLLPVFVDQLISPTAQSLGLALLVLAFIAYILKTANLVHADYWRALRYAALLEERARELERLTVTDGLTQIANRVQFDRRLAQEWAGAARRGDAVSVMVIDLDHFKRINDGHGHPVGDSCLIAAAAALQGALHRAVDLVARYGGEEFAVLLPDTSAVAAAEVADRLRVAVQSIALEHDGQQVRITCSIGVATLSPHALPDKPAASVALADSALYDAKAAGRNRVAVAQVPAWMAPATRNVPTHFDLTR
jgi:diguanylate cyclase (GGDEF)-like protein